MGQGNSAVETIRKVRRWDKLKALELLGKHLVMFTDRHEHAVDDEFVARLRAAIERAKASRQLKKNGHAGAIVAQ